MAEASRTADRASLAAIAAVVIGTVVLAAALPVARTGPPSTASAFQDDPTCLEWTDACIVCTRGDHGPHCSTPGIACEREAPKCRLRRAGS